MRTAPTFRVSRLFSLLMYLLFALVSPAAAQHGGGGGGGHSGGGGHFGGGHSGGHASGHHSRSSHRSSTSHPGGHFHWLPFRSAKHLSEGTGSAATDVPSTMWNFSTARSSMTRRVPSTLLWSPATLRPESAGRPLFANSPRAMHRARFFGRYSRFASSGCFFNGVSQVCFFEPLFPLLCFDGFDYGFGFGGGWFGGDGTDAGDVSQGMDQADMSGISQPANPPGETTAGVTAAANAESRAEAAADAHDWDLGSDVFVLVLHNETTQLAKSYWASDGYLEYITPDGIRSHVPLDALDLQNTVLRNERRGVPFVLRSMPAGNQ